VAPPSAPAFGSGYRVYNVIDVRQSYPQKVVREGLRALGHRAEADRSVHFSYEIVALSPAAARELAERFGEEYRLSPEDEKKPFVEMSGRKGLGVKADDLVELLLERSRAEIASRRGTEGGSAAAEEDARSIAVGALRYFLLKVRRNKIIAFISARPQLRGDTGQHLQYSSAPTTSSARWTKGIGRSRRRPRDAGATVVGAVLDALRRPTSPSAVSRRSWPLARHAFARAGLQPLLPPAADRPEPDAGGNRRLAVARIFRRETATLLGLLGSGVEMIRNVARKVIPRRAAPRDPFRVQGANEEPTMNKVNLLEKFALFTEQFQPKVVGDLNDHQVKVVKLQGEFVWHHHDDADELFLVVKGRMRMGRSPGH
jgi:hypothetical protein